MNRKMFPILGTNQKEYIPWDSIAPHENQAWMNHGQSLEKLASRGGLSWCETLAVLLDSKFRNIPEEEAKRKVLNIIPNQEWIVPVSWEVCGFIKVRANSAEEACQKVHDNPDDFPLPKQFDYIDASFDVSGDISEASDMSEIYTKDYHNGKWGRNIVF